MGIYFVYPLKKNCNFTKILHKNSFQEYYKLLEFVRVEDETVTNRLGITPQVQRLAAENKMTTRFKEVVYAKALSRELPSVVFSATEPILLTRWTIKPVGSDGWSVARI